VAFPVGVASVQPLVAFLVLVASVQSLAAFDLAFLELEASDHPWVSFLLDLVASGLVLEAFPLVLVAFGLDLVALVAYLAYQQPSDLGHFAYLAQQELVVQEASSALIVEVASDLLADLVLVDHPFAVLPLAAEDHCPGSCFSTD